MCNELSELRAKCEVTAESARKVERPTFWPASQLLTGRSRQPVCALALAAILAIGLSAACNRSDSKQAVASGSAREKEDVRRGGQLVVSARTEPRTFNRLLSREATTDFVASLMQSRLVRINQVTDEVEPWLAESWTRSDSGLVYTLKLRPGVAFSDGHPMTADDVVFSLAAAYAVPFSADSLEIDGKKLAMAAVDPLTVTLTMPVRYAPGLRILNNLWVLPRHRLEAALNGGTLEKAWTLATPPADIAGLGPFVLTQYSAGQRLVFARNPRYWRQDGTGIQLPYLDQLVLEIVPEENTQLLRLTSGASDSTISEVPAEAYATVKRVADEGKLKLYDLGVGLDPDALWLNLTPGAFKGDPRAAWIQRDELRRAISMAVDRQLFADTVFLGAGLPVFGPLTPANKKWYSPDAAHAPHDPAAARALLQSIGLRDADGDGQFEDAAGSPARFTVVTQKGRPSLERGVSVIRDELKKVGIAVDVVALEGGAVIEKIMSGKYDAVYFHPYVSDTDPAGSPDFWLSSGSLHFWNIGQKTPATEWEKRIDGLMIRQMQSLDEAERKRLFDEVQKIFAEHQPAIYFVAPRVFAAASTRTINVTPAVQRPQLLWSPDSVAVAQQAP
jgi:peptide/nickel transport system substrate-binding protein